jgi:hypothetical protein
MFTDEAVTLRLDKQQKKLNCIRFVLGGPRFGFWTKKPAKYDEKEPLVEKLFEYVQFM